MSSTLRSATGLLFMLLAGCGVFDRGPLDPSVAAKVTVAKIDPPPGCDFLGAVRGSTPLGDLADAHGDVLRKAVLRGGNYVAVDLVERPVVLGVGGYVLSGRLFACPVPGTAGAPPVAPVAQMAPPGDVSGVKPCDPECATGYSCQLGACIALPASQAAAPTN